MFSQLMLAVHALVSSAAIPLENRRTLDIRVDSGRQEIVISVGPVSVPAATLYSHHAREEYIHFQWPASGWVRGYRIELFDSTGRTLGRDMLHHAGIANLGRRQIAYGQAERLFASARETTPVTLPASMGLPLAGNERMVMYFALVNPTPQTIDGVILRVTLAWTPETGQRLANVLPFYVNAKPDLEESISFDIAPGRSSTSAEFTLPAGGHLRALGGHLHDYGVELRLEDAESNRVLARLGTERDAAGRIRSVGRTYFRLKRHGLRLDPNRRYRVVAVYENPTCATIRAGAMGFVVGAFIPDDIRSWPTVDPSDPAFQRDLAGLAGIRPESSSAVGGSDHSGHHGHDASSSAARHANSGCNYGGRY